MAELRLRTVSPRADAGRPKLSYPRSTPERVRRSAGPPQDTPDSPPLIGVENMKMPEWARVDERVAGAGFGRAVRALPAAIAVVLRLAWRTSPRLTLLAGVVHVVSGCVTAFGLLATANVFTALLQQGPTPERVMQSLPAIAVVTGSYAARAVLDAAVAAVEGALRPQVTAAADDAVTAAVVRVGLIAFEDADFRELARQGARYGVRAIETSLRRVADLTSSAISLAAAMLTAGLLNPWLAPVLLLAAAADGWSAARVAKLNYRHFLDTVGRNIRKSIVEEVATWRSMALERHALTLQEPLLGEYRRISRSLTREEIRLAHRSNLVRTSGRAAAGLGTAVAYLVLGWLLYTGGMELALAGTAVLAMRTASTALSNTMRAVNSLYEDSFYIGFYNQLLLESAKLRPPPTALTAPADPAEIRLEGVTFTYPGQKKPALRDISLTIRRGEVIALVGENGSGKTTLGKLLTGLYPPDEGTVHWDDVDLARADPESVHTNIAVIAQEPAEWPMTAANNITVGRLGRPDPDRRAWREAVDHSGSRRGDRIVATSGKHGAVEEVRRRPRPVRRPVATHGHRPRHLPRRVGPGGRRTDGGPRRPRRSEGVRGPATREHVEPRPPHHGPGDPPAGQHQVRGPHPGPGEGQVDRGGNARGPDPRRRGVPRAVRDPGQRLPHRLGPTGQALSLTSRAPTTPCPNSPRGRAQFQFVGHPLLDRVTRQSVDARTRCGQLATPMRRDNARHSRAILSCTSAPS